MTTAPSTAPEGSEGVSALGHTDRVRLEALRYAVNDEAASYLAIMRLFSGATSGLLSDQSAVEVQTGLGILGVDLPLEVVDARLDYLVGHGNLARSPRESQARSISEYLQTRARYQLTQRGELVHRLIEEILGTSDSAREVSSEMLGAIAAGLSELLELASSDVSTIAPERLSGAIVTLFAQFERLVESTRAFYTYLAQVLSRFDLDRGEFQAFKGALIGYLQQFVDEIARTMPQLGHTLVRLEPLRPALLAQAGSGARLVGLDGRRAQRDRGLADEDWDALHRWFLGDVGRDSDATQVRALATQAMSSLLLNLRRITAGDDREASRYRDFLRLARWFDDADAPAAHALWAAAFGLYPSRHLGFRADDDADPVPSTASWWSTPVAQVPVTLRESGDRTMRGSPARAADFSASKARRIADRVRTERQRTDALVELSRHHGDLTQVRVSDAAREQLLDLYATCLSSGRWEACARAGEVIVRLRAAPRLGATTRISSPSGVLTLCDMSLALDRTRDRASAADDDGIWSDRSDRDRTALTAVRR